MDTKTERYKHGAFNETDAKECHIKLIVEPPLRGRNKKKTNVFGLLCEGFVGNSVLWMKFATTNEKKSNYSPRLRWMVNKQHFIRRDYCYANNSS